MVSEDTDQLMSGLAAIHRLSDLRDVRQTRTGPMGTEIDHLERSERTSRSHAASMNCIGCAMKKGMIVSIRSFPRRTT